MKSQLFKQLQISFKVKPPKLLRHFYTKTVWKGDSSGVRLYLTFDDGPVPALTPWILDQLEQFNAKATFFCIGKNVKENPELFELILEKGHRVGNHTYSHLNGFRTSNSRYIHDVNMARKYVNSDLFRPPFGRIRYKAKRILETNFKIVMWDVLSMDYDQSIQPSQVVQNVISNAGQGSIIVFHDNLKAEENLKFALPLLLDYYKKRGFEFVTLPG